jgi:hypothetical protein
MSLREAIKINDIKISAEQDTLETDDSSEDSDVSSEGSEEGDDSSDADRMEGVETSLLDQVAVSNDHLNGVGGVLPDLAVASLASVATPGAVEVLDGPAVTAVAEELDLDDLTGGVVNGSGVGGGLVHETGINGTFITSGASTAVSAVSTQELQSQEQPQPRPEPEPEPEPEPQEQLGIGGGLDLDFF